MQPTPPWHIATKERKKGKKRETLDMDGKFYPIFFFSWLVVVMVVVVVVVETGTENSQKGDQDAGWEKVKK